MRRGWFGLVFALLCVGASISSWAGEVHVYTDREIRPALLKLLNQAEQSIDIEMYVLTDTDVIATLERAEARGVQVRMILDPNQSGNQRHGDGREAGTGEGGTWNLMSFVLRGFDFMHGLAMIKGR